MRSRRDERILRSLEEDERVLARFWSSIDTGASTSACWQWHGPASKRFPTFQVGPRTVAAARVAWWTVLRAFPSGGRFYRTCGNDLCVRPDHLAWQLGQSAERSLNPYGPFAPSGVPLRVAVTEGERPKVLRFVSREAAAALPMAG